MESMGKYKEFASLSLPNKRGSFGKQWKSNLLGAKVTLQKAVEGMWQFRADKALLSACDLINFNSSQRHLSRSVP